MFLRRCPFSAQHPPHRTTQPTHPEAPKRRGNAERLMNRIAQLSRDVLESIKLRISCAPKAARSKRDLEKKRVVSSLDIPRIVSDVGSREIAENGMQRNHRSLEISGLDQRRWRGVHGDVVRALEERQRISWRMYELDELVVDELVGKGVHGSVHRGRICGRTVAVKYTHEANTVDGKGAKARLPPERELMHGVCHTNLVQIYGVHKVEKDWGWALDDTDSDCESSLNSYTFSRGTCENGNLYGPGGGNGDHLRTVVVMEFCDMGNVWDAAKRGEFRVGGKLGFPDYRRILEVALDVAFGMQHLHEQGIIHGDLTAKNVLLNSTNSGRHFVAKVGDFGMCRRPEFNRFEITTFSLGSVDHMAPETLRDGRVHNATDVFSFSILLYEIITGKHAFQGLVPAAVLVAIVEGRRPKLPQGCPSGLVSLIHECWHQDWHYRPSFSVILGRLINVLA